MRRLLLLVLLSALPFVGGAQARPAAWGVIDRGAPDCTQIPPEESPALATSTDDRLTLKTRFLYERGDLQTVKDHVEVTERAFDRIGIDLLPTFERLPIPEAWKARDGVSGDVDSNDQFVYIKEHFGGHRPPQTDVVYFFTRYWAGGRADCIGGVRWSDKAFALGSIDYAIEGMVPAPTANEGVIAAHEIGHLLGAHHHYSNCLEAAPKGAPAGEIAPCTVMSPLATTASSVFGLVETSFVRHYLQEYGVAGSQV